MSSDKMEALKSMAITNPDGSDDGLSDLFSFSSDVEEAQALLGGMTPAKTGTLLVSGEENHLHRSEEDMGRLLSEIEAASFTSDKVEVIKKEAEERPNPPLSAAQLVDVLKLIPFSGEAKEVLDVFAGPRLVFKMACSEIVDVLGVFRMSSDRLEVLPSLKPFILDAQRKIRIIREAFSMSSDRSTAEEILRDVEMELEPPEPPAAKVQEALRRVGGCPSGYAWRKVSSGWRCAAGGHYVSDEKLSAAI